MYIPQDPTPNVCVEEPYTEKYLQYAQDLGPPPLARKLVDFFDVLDLTDGFSAYMKTTRGMFASIAQQAPTYPKSEPSMMQWFCRAVQEMQQMDFTEYPLARPTVAYHLRPYRSTATGAYLASDAALCYSGCRTDTDGDAHILVSSSAMFDYIRNMTRGRMAERVLRVWRSQPARAFVPVVFLYNADLVLLVFDQQKWHRFGLGRLFREERAASGCKMAVVERTLRVLWFLLIQRPADFGQGTGGGVLTVLGPFRFGGTRARATIEPANQLSGKDDPNAVILGKAVLMHWGSARLMLGHKALSAEFVDRLEGSWGVPIRRNMLRQLADGPETKDPMYRSIFGLAGAHRHTVDDDIESLFYLALHMALCIEQGASCGFLGVARGMVPPPADVVQRRAEAMKSQATYLKLVGIEKCPVFLAKRLDGMFSSLFVRKRRGSISRDLHHLKDKPQARVAESGMMTNGSGSSSGSSSGSGSSLGHQGQKTNGNRRLISPSVVAGSSGDKKKLPAQPVPSNKKHHP
ncbi:hypothetical protein GGI15_002788 [Coemansia interrupta]|uniref:Uncharacterized protein n=1 Tax=Coemansia interrupta TaxID=1126814 RepID=A0A9W8HBY3_9FUNG|nr:hypothetical protein GGI15_002788 [Coemansia interrupta]